MKLGVDGELAIQLADAKYPAYTTGPIDPAKFADTPFVKGYLADLKAAGYAFVGDAPATPATAPGDSGGAGTGAGPAPTDAASASLTSTGVVKTTAAADSAKGHGHHAGGNTAHRDKGHGMTAARGGSAGATHPRGARYVVRTSRHHARQG